MELRPDVCESPEAWPIVRGFVSRLAEAEASTQDERARRIEEARAAVLRTRDEWPRSWRAKAVAVIHVLGDLAAIGWALEPGRERIWATRPPETGRDEQREVRRRQLHAQRDQQLRDPSVCAFVRDMESPDVSDGRSTSIFSLMRDGRNLALELREVASLPPDQRAARLGRVVAPYVQFVEEQTRCEHTGLKLTDIWRYFRHTWANPYQSVPGRSMALLVRDAAAPKHPVVGIAAISSAAVQMTSRDKFIGWEADTFVESAAANPRAEISDWAVRAVHELIDELYKTDFIADELFSTKDLEASTPELIDALDEAAAESRREHHRHMRAGEYKKAVPGYAEEEHWEEQARQPLFRAKRAEELADLLRLRRTFTDAFQGHPTAEGLQRLLSAGEGRIALGRLARKVKARRVGVAIADLTVCGAIPPYGALLGGKLVAMLAASPAVVAEYKRRYSGVSSIIASSMAGKQIARPAELVFIGTTSLYGVRPSQYDRISIPCERLGGKSADCVRYEFLEHTSGTGTFQFGQATVEAFGEFLRQTKNGLQVNSVFGEGANPRLRKIRDALAALGLPGEALLTHGLDKLVYAVSLIRNMRDYLLGIDPTPQFLFDVDSADGGVTAISSWWRERWVAPRLGRPEVLAEIERHTLTLPVRHGARVPRVEEAGSPALFVFD